MNRTKIEWVKNPDGTQGYSWNPIKGLCPVGCWYCYARAMYKNPFYGWSQEIRGPFFDEKDFYRIRNTPSRIFICSTFELFHPTIKKATRDLIFMIIHDNPQHTFQILTKMPQNIDRPMPDNVWLGVSITGEKEEHDCYQGLLDTEARVKFISFEPLLKPVYLPQKIDWVIIGRLTGHGKKHDPSFPLLQIMVNTFQVYKIPIFMKDNLKDIWGDSLIQEFPNLNKGENHE